MKKFRLGIILELPVEVGGGFQQSLNEILWLQRWAASADIEAPVYSTLGANVAPLRDFGIEAKLLRLGWRDRLFLFLKYSGVFDLLQYALRAVPQFEKRLIGDGVDIAYFTTTSNWHLALYKLPFAITVYDNCHRDSPEFDEVREFAEFERREMLFRSACTKAAIVIANAREIIDALVRRYSMDRERAVCIPFSPSPYVDRAVRDTTDDGTVLAKYGIEPGYLFYPAQFWSHKNHATVLSALVLLQKRGTSKRLVLCGSDRGARDMVEALIVRLGLTDQVRILGFVPSSELAALYRGAAALVMASYFGPTNLPPLEAWSFGTPVIYPQAFAAQAGDAALLFDYDSPNLLVEAIIALESPEVRS
ncbi:MAG TPA: glycosyltransferase, partial [Burkholderiales bacterium]|nr:glycosyltransferase [Burkholderiales bacterium]